MRIYLMIGLTLLIIGCGGGNKPASLPDKIEPLPGKGKPKAGNEGGDTSPAPTKAPVRKADASKLPG
ncbi:hypothetical protein [Zavarzinella formosa]|uniref:hypothetical protein n=1 Tax=Zavarzinella formosa TaxID=360055 RepID=UPI0002FDF87C|nr:hypothetical protein [Zavarzinella formosa]